MHCSSLLQMLEMCGVSLHLSTSHALVCTSSNTDFFFFGRGQCYTMSLCGIRDWSSLFQCFKQKESFPLFRTIFLLNEQSCFSPPLCVCERVCRYVCVWFSFDGERGENEGCLLKSISVMLHMYMCKDGCRFQVIWVVLYSVWIVWLQLCVGFHLLPPTLFLSCFTQPCSFKVFLIITFSPPPLLDHKITYCNYILAD